MTSHQFAKQLLALEDLEILVPRVVEYSDEEENNGAAPSVFKEMAFDHDGKKVPVWIINYQDPK